MPASGTISSGCRAGASNSAAAASRSASSDCVIGSCSSFAAADCSASSAGQPAMSMRMPRSTRRIGNVAPRNSSVALLAQGEIVPSRGTTKRDNEPPSRSATPSPACRMRASAAASGDAPPAGTTQYVHQAPVTRNPGCSARRRASRRSRRNGDRAGWPSRTIMSGKTRGNGRAL
jgi:hypothetical protein